MNKGVFQYDDVDKWLKDIRDQYESQNGPLVWRGSDDLDSSILCCCPPPTEQFNEEGLEYHAERDRDFWDVYTLVAFQLGFHNGVCQEKSHYKILEDSNKVYRDIIKDLKDGTKVR